MSNMFLSYKNVYQCHKDVRIEYTIRGDVVYIEVYYSWFKTPREIILPIKYWRGAKTFCEVLLRNG